LSSAAWAASLKRHAPYALQLKNGGDAFANVNPWPVLTFPRAFDAVREHLMSQQ
jgi:hypothetical protein